MVAMKGSYREGKPVCGIGYKGMEPAVGSDGKHLKSYVVWKSILTRVTSDKRYEDVKVCQEWLDYRNFKMWFNSNYIEGFEIDKDLLSGDDKVYSPNTCIFLPPEVNKMITSSQLNATGVHKKRNKWRARLHIEGKSFTSTVKDTYEEAVLDYKQLRIKEVKRILHHHIRLNNITEQTGDLILDLYINQFNIS